METTSFVFDMDSTLIRGESLEDLVRCSLSEAADPKSLQALTEELERITRAGMNGEIDFDESLARRIALAPIRRKHVDQIVEKMLGEMTEGMAEWIDDLQRHGHDTWIVSGGLREMILPLARVLGIREERFFGNEAIWTNGILSGLQPSPLRKNTGKSTLLSSLKNAGKIRTPIVMIGDGMGDLHVYLSGVADDFYGFGEHAVRPAVQEKAPYFFTSVASMRLHAGL
jgi:HAD superfamily phosphoserine phosphatase-like hydrolase